MSRPAAHAHSGLRSHLGRPSLSALLVSGLLLLLATAGCEPQRTPADAPGAGAPPMIRVSTADTAWTPDSASVRLFRVVMERAVEEDWHERPVGELVQAVGLQFRGQPYEAGMLDEPDTETLICRLNGFDCVTFVETSLALARIIRAQDYTYDAFLRHVRDTRYRGGQMDGYCSRMHYFTEWIADNAARGAVRDVTQEVGGERLDKTLGFMSAHRDAYPRFATDDALYRCIQEMEARLADHEIYYVPQDRIHEAYDQLQAGDLVALATDIEGLDVTHTGLVYKGPDGATGLLHASTTGGVMVSPDLQAYVQNVDVQIGIVVARPQPTGRNPST